MEIKNKEEYLAALEKFEAIFHATNETPEGAEANVLAKLIKDYEEQHYVIETADYDLKK